MNNTQPKRNASFLVALSFHHHIYLPFVQADLNQAKTTATNRRTPAQIAAMALLPIPGLAMV